MRRFHVEEALLPEGLARQVAVTVDFDGTILSVGDGDPSLCMRGLLLPGLINAHAHLELSALRGQVDGGAGLVSWVGELQAQRGDHSPEVQQRAILEAVCELQAWGAAGVAEVSNSLAAASALDASSLVGVLHQEVIGFDAPGLPPLSRPAVRGFTVRPSPHAPYSCSAALMREAVAEAGPPATIHLDEDGAERALLRDGGGLWAAVLDALGRDRSGFTPPGCTPVAYMDQLGLLGPGLALVHLVLAGVDDLDLVAASGATVVLCPRSNRHIGGQLPDIRGLVERGIPLAIGTDSLASVPDLDLLAEVAELIAAAPEVDPVVWLQALTTGGAELLGRPELGRIQAGARPGLLLLEGSVDTLYAAMPRRWLVRPGQAEGVAEPLALRGTQ